MPSICVLVRCVYYSLALGIQYPCAWLYILHCFFFMGAVCVVFLLHGGLDICAGFLGFIPEHWVYYTLALGVVCTVRWVYYAHALSLVRSRALGILYPSQGVSFCALGILYRCNGYIIPVGGSLCLCVRYAIPVHRAGICALGIIYLCSVCVSA